MAAGARSGAQDEHRTFCRFSTDRCKMVSPLGSFSGLSTANIATLFGTAAPSSDPTAKDGANTSAGASSGTQITGAGSGPNAAKAIQAIVAQIQIEKMQTSTQGKISTLDLASVSVTYGATAEVDSDPQSINSGTTVLSSVATATGDTTADAVGTLMAEVKAQEAEVEAQQDGLLMTKTEEAFDSGSGTNSVNWTSNSVILDINAAANRGIELYNEENSLDGIQGIVGEAQNFQAPSATGASAASAQKPASSSSSPGPNGSALYLQVAGPSYSALAGKEQQLVSDFLKGALPGQNGAAPENGAGFDYSWQTGDGDEHAYNIQAVMISNYDPAALAYRIHNDVDQNAWISADEKTVAMGGTVVNDSHSGFGNGLMDVVIPLNNP